MGRLGLRPDVGLLQSVAQQRPALLGLRPGLLLQLVRPGRIPGQLCSQLHAAPPQGLHRLQSPLRLAEFGFGLGYQAGLMVAAAVLPQLQPLLRRRIAVPGPACGSQASQPPGQILILGHRQLRAAEKCAALEHAALHPQQGQAAVGRRQLRHVPARFLIPGPEAGHGLAPFGGPLQHQHPALPFQLHGARHGLAAPGLVAALFRQAALGGPLAGVNAVEHGRQKGGPGGFSLLVVQPQPVQARLQGQLCLIQASEGGRHIPNQHGASLPSRAAST